MLLFTLIKSMSNAINFNLIFVVVWLYSFVVQGIFILYIVQLLNEYELT